MAVETKPVTDRIPVVGPDGRLTPYFLDVFRGLERAIGGPGIVSIPSSEVVGAATNELVRFNADGNLENTGMIADTTLTVPAAVEYPGKMERFEATAAHSALALSGAVALLPAVSGERWKVAEIMLTASGTNFSGGNRALGIKQGATVYSTIPALTLQTLANGRWGDTGVPFPATDLMTATAAGESIILQYSGGTTDYTAGSCTISLIGSRSV